MQSKFFGKIIHLDGMSRLFIDARQVKTMHAAFVFNAVTPYYLGHVSY